MTKTENVAAEKRAVPERIAITVNGEPVEAIAGGTLLALVAERIGRPLDERGVPLDGNRLGIAAAVGGAVVPRSRWGVTALAAGDEVEIVTAAQGG
ncbi:sulfur carrier protein ThiS [Gulosibacter faecalis]|jgi:sulfur carrier protein|uniref:Sulfur carrier protein ThiS n=1 Tax=Gulosibacter faecalis TaxID=272240 RepID=A0ABW5UY97_9MICO|nr:sulfur carrier protein ThiS [Gulosibacter faecalis]